MIYSINEGVLDKFKKGNTTESEFNSIFTNLNKLIRSLENNESKFASSNKGLKRLREHENNNIEKIKNDFLNGNPSFIVYHMIFEMESSTKDSKIDNKQSVVNAVKQFAASCGFKDINTTQNRNIYLDARNSEKYPTLIIELSIFKHPKRGEMVDIGLFSDRNTCRLKKESAKNESVTLSGLAADNFLESIGIDINIESKTISIGEMIIDGIAGEDILAENGIFLYEDGIVLEGKQADKYLTRKAEEAYDAKEKDNERKERRYDDDYRPTVGIKNTINKDGTKYKGVGSREETKPPRRNSQDYHNQKMAERIRDSEESRRYYAAENDDNKQNRDAYERMKQNSAVAFDATNRHIRRHPKQYKESAIFKYVDLISE